MVFILRKPSLMEDEGRYQYYGVFGSARQAEQFIDDIVDKSNNYYSRYNFVITKEI